MASGSNNHTMRTLPALFFLFSLAFVAQALATVDPNADARADRLCSARPAICGLRP